MSEEINKIIERCKLVNSYRLICMIEQILADEGYEFDTYTINQDKIIFVDLPGIGIILEVNNKEAEFIKYIKG